MKKILNLFVSLSLITAGASSVVACGSHRNQNPPTPPPPKPDDQRIVNDIANKINDKTITVLQSGVYKPSELANNYTKGIEKQINNLLTPIEQKSGYQISGWDNTNIYWPYLNKATGKEVDKNKKNPIPLNIKIGQDIAKVKAKITLEFQYYKQKKVLDDPREASQSNPLPIEETTVAEWNQGLAREDINQAWGDSGGLTGDLEKDVIYKQVLEPGEPVQPITDQQAVECELYFKDGILGYTQNHPRYFYVKGN